MNSETGQPVEVASHSPAGVAVNDTPLGSLRTQLLHWLLIPLILLMALNTLSVYRNALDAADMAYDRSLLASTRALAERVSVAEGKVVVDVPYVALDSFETDTLGRIYYKVTGIQGETVSGFGDLPGVPASVPRSEAYPALVRFYHANYNGQPVRIAALLQPVFDDSMRGIALIQVAETTDARRGLTNKILFDTLVWQAGLILAAGLLVWFAVRLVLRPLMRLKEAVETRSVSDLSDVDPALVHKEVRPLVAAMNASMSRIQGLIASQRRFIADASHQLRTPLTVLKTQTEMALREVDRASGTAQGEVPADSPGGEPGSAQRAALRSMLVGIASTTDSAVHLANRLLMLARIEHSGGTAPVPVELRALAQQAALQLAVPAVNKQIDLALEAEHEATVPGQPLLLQEMITNLVDNALRYTPSGGSVTVRLLAGPGRIGAAKGAGGAGIAGGAVGPVLEVEDSGAGILESERERVFSPFYRAAASMQANPGGAGLGLAIVRDIAALHGAVVALSDGANGRGLKVSVVFPLV